MKKTLFGMMAFAILFATSCTNELDPVNGGDTSTVSFKVETPKIESRAYSDGETATVLQYAVYDAAGNELPDLTKSIENEKTESINGSTTVNLTLTTGNTYSVIFWAAAPNAPYAVDFANKTMTVDYKTVAPVCNDETRDAFYKYHTFTVTGAQTETIELKRPFAQLNIGTADYAASTSAGYTPKQSAVTVNNVYSTLDLATGEVDGAVEVTYASADIKKDETFPVEGYEYLAMNYLLVNAEKELVDIKFTYTDGSNDKTRTVGSVPVQRNYRTNIYGKILTSDVDINVEIKPEYGGEFNNEGYFIESDGTAVVESASGLATIAAMINAGELAANTNITLEGDIDLNDPAATGRSVSSNWTPIGTGQEISYTGTFDGKGYTIKNFNYTVTGEDEAWYVGIFGYAKDATIKNLVMENVNIYSEQAYFAEVGAVVGHLEGTSTLENITIKGEVKIEGNVDNVEASRIGAVVGGNASGTITIKNVHVTANEGGYVKGGSHVGGIAGQLQLINTFENCSSNVDVTAGRYFAGGIIGCAGQRDTYTNCHTTGNIAVLAGRSGNANDLYRVGGIAGGWNDNDDRVCTLIDCSFEGTVLGKDADENVAETLDCFGFVGRGYAAKVGSKVIVNGTEFVYQGNGNYTINGLTPVATAEELVAALKAKEGVLFMNDITIAATKGGYTKAGILQNEAQTIDGNGHTLTVTGAGATKDCAIYTNGGTIKNLTVAGAMRGIFTAGTNTDLYIDNVIFKNVVYTFNSDDANKNYGVYISNSTINGWTSHTNKHKEVVYTNCSFGEGSGYKYCRPYGPTSFIGCDFCEGYNINVQSQIVTLENCTLNGVSVTAENLATLVTGTTANAIIK